MNLLTFLLCSAGLTTILTISKLLKPIRPKHHFFSCALCQGFWVGFFLWYFQAVGWISLFTFPDDWMTGFLLGCASSITSWILVMFGMYLEDNKRNVE